MREYGRWIKNIAAFFLLMALLSLLLPFCRFQAAGEKVELSGMEVLATAGRAGITYARHNEIPDSFVVKEPFTWGEMKNGFSYAQDAVGNKTLLGGGGRRRWRGSSPPDGCKALQPLQRRQAPWPGDRWR